MQLIDHFNPTLPSGLQALTLPSLTRFNTVAEAQAGIPDGETNVCYVESKEAFYRYCAVCTIPADGDLILTTGGGVNTRWEMVQKVSRTQGDTGWISLGGAISTILNPTTMRLALSSVGLIAIKAVRTELPIGNYDVVISGSPGVKFIYFDDDTGVLKFSSTLFDFGTQVPVQIAYWTGSAIAGGQTEYHGIRDTVWHYWAHNFFGTQYQSGLAITTNTQPDNGTDPNNDNVQYLWLTPGVLYDEDAKIDVGSGNWAQTLGSGLTSTTAAIIPFYYWNGTAITSLAAMSDRTPFIHGGTGTTPQWENAGVLTAAPDNTYVVYHYFGSPQIGGQAVFARPHNAIFAAPGNIAGALAARPSQLTWTNYAELKHLYSIVFRVETSWGASPDHLCKIVAVQDFRLVAGSPTAAANPTAHSGLTGLTGPDVHPDTSITSTTNAGALQSAVENNVGLALTRLATFGNISNWGASLAYRVDNMVAYAQGIFKCFTANSDPTFTPANWTQISPMNTPNAGTAAGIPGAFGWLLYVRSLGMMYRFQDDPAAAADGVYFLNTANGGTTRWVAIRDFGAPETSVTITAGDAIDLSGQVSGSRQYAVIGNAAGRNAMSITPFGTSAPSNTIEVTMIGRSNANTVTLATNDSNKGALISGGFVELGAGTILRLKYSPTLDRWVEVSRNNL